MSGVFERLAEDWLDRAGERTYQGPFCQMLAALGHEVLINTRHSPLEFGKDIIARSRKGKVRAFQLKGDPGGRLTLKKFRDIKSQLDFLIETPVSHPAIREGTPHRSFLVTNGEVEEEALLAIKEINRGYRERGMRGCHLSVVSRGRLLRWARNLGHALWPSELEDKRLLLNHIAKDGRTLLPLTEVHALLQRVLLVEEKTTKRPSAAGLRRRVASAALVTGIMLQEWYRAENHWGVFQGWTLFSSYVLASCERHKHGAAKHARWALAVARQEMFNALAALCEELRGRKPGEYVEGQLVADYATYRSRLLLLKSLMALYWFWCEDEGWPSVEHKPFVQEFMAPRPVDLWGQAAIPQALMYAWWLRAASAAGATDGFLYGLLGECAPPPSDEVNLPGPYYTWDDVLRARLGLPLPSNKDGLLNATRSDGSYFATGVLHLFVRTNNKRACKDFWPQYTHQDHRWFEPAAKWRYCLLTTDAGENHSQTVEPEKQWDDLRRDARSVAVPHVPKSLAGDRMLLAAFVLAVPHRATPHVVRRLGWQFDPQWFIGDPIDH